MFLLCTVAFSKSYLMNKEIKYDTEKAVAIDIKTNNPFTGEAHRYHKKTEKISWKATYLDGKNLKSTSYYKNGKIKNTNNNETKKYNEFFETGELKAEGSLDDFKLNGIFTSYHKNGNTRYILKGTATVITSGMIFYNNANKKIFYKTGELYSEFIYKNSKKVFYENYFITGEKREERVFKDGETQLSREYFETGELAWESFYTKGKKTQTKQYYQEGNLAAELTLSKGKAISGYKYTFEGKKSKMTNAHFHNMGFEY